MAAEPKVEELMRFYQERAKPKKVALFRIDKQGNLAEYDTKGTLVKTIVLPTYRPPTEEEFREMEKERLDRIALANRAFEDARRQLYQSLQERTKSRSEILDLNRAVREADILLQSARFPLRGVVTESSVKIKEIDFNQTHETRVFPYHIAFAQVRPFTLQQQYVRVGDIPLPQMVSVAEALQATEMKAETVILFSDQDMEISPYGFLSLGWPVAISFNDKIYQSARHAIFAELAREFNDLERANAIQSTESATDIHYRLDDVAGGRDVNQMKWNTTLSRLIDMVNIAKFKQYPELAQRLMELPSPLVIGAYEPNDIQMGIGLSLNNVKAKDKLSWTGENLIGKALMKIRENLIMERAQLAAQSVKRPRKVRIAPAVQAQQPAVQAQQPAVQAQQPAVQAQQPAVQAPPPITVESSMIPEEANSIKSISFTSAPVVRRGPRIAPRPMAQ